MYFEDINTTVNKISPVYQMVIGFMFYNRKDTRRQLSVILGLGDSCGSF